MKNELKVIAIATIITCLLIVGCSYATAEPVQIYSVVIDFDYELDTVSCLDEAGNIWDFDGIEDWIIGDQVILTIETETDEIVELRYIGWLDIFELSHYVIDVCD